MGRPSTRERLTFLEGEESVPDRRIRRDRWRTNNSTLDDYFQEVVLPGYPEGVLAIIERQLSKTKRNIGMDIAGGRNGVVARQLLRMGLLEKALVSNYRDRRNVAARINPHLAHAKGDLTKLKPWERMMSWQTRHAPHGLALVLHRPDGGLQEQSPGFYEGATHLLLDMMQPEAVLFTQIPSSLRQHPDELADMCEGVNSRPDVGFVIQSKTPPRPGGPWQYQDCALVIKH